jgi:hypothetical protein
MHYFCHMPVRIDCTSRIFPLASFIITATEINVTPSHFKIFIKFNSTLRPRPLIMNLFGASTKIVLASASVIFPSKLVLILCIPAFTLSASSSLLIHYIFHHFYYDSTCYLDATVLFSSSPQEKLQSANARVSQVCKWPLRFLYEHAEKHTLL